MSYGSYQPFNPTAPIQGNGFVSGGMKSAVQGLNQSPGAMLGGGPAQLPGAQDPNSQQYFQQMRENVDNMDTTLQKIEQSPPGMAGGKSGPGSMFGGGKSFGSPSLQTMELKNPDYFTKGFNQ